jgi:hypothetical protein
MRCTTWDAHRCQDRHASQATSDRELIYIERLGQTRADTLGVLRGSHTLHVEHRRTPGASSTTRMRLATVGLRTGPDRWAPPLLVHMCLHAPV